MEYSINAKIPEEYIPESEIRMELYYRLGNLASREEVQEILSEMIDRFGPAPEPVLLLCLFTKLRLFASELNLISIKLDKTTVRMEKTQGTKTVSAIALLPNRKDLNVFEESFQKILKDFASKKIC